MKIVKRILSLLIMSAMLMPCLFVANAFEGENSVQPYSTEGGYETFAVGDSGLTNISMGDIGPKYVAGNSLKQSVNIGGENISLSYESSDESVIAADGSVTHGNNIKIVTVTPKATIGESEVKGTPTPVLVLPTSYETLLSEDFESFDAGILEHGSKPNGWTVSYKGADERIEILTDETGNKYLGMGVYGAAYGSSNPVFSKNFAKGSVEGSYTVTAARIYTNSAAGSSGNGNTFRPITHFKNTYLQGGEGTSVQFDGFAQAWHDYVFVSDNDDVVESGGQTFKKTTVYVDGNLVSSDFYSLSWDAALLISIYRGYSQYAYYDDLLVFDFEKPRIRLSELENIKLANVTDTYIAAPAEGPSQLPQEITITQTGYEGTYNLTYISTNEEVIDSEGNVTHADFTYNYANVKPRITLSDGEVVEGLSQKLVVLPKNVDILFSDDFTNSTDGSTVTGSATSPNAYNKWYGNEGVAAEKVSMKTENFEGNRVLSLAINASGISPNPQISQKGFYSEGAGTNTCLSFKLYYENNLRLGIRNFGYIMPGGMQNTSQSTILGFSNGSVVSRNWCTITLVKNGITLKTDVYIDGVYQGRANTTAADDELAFFYYRNDVADAKIDDILLTKVTDFENMEKVRDELDIGDCDNVENDLVLPSTGIGNVEISWSVTCDEGVAEITDDNILTINRIPGQDQYASLTATFFCNGTTLTRNFDLTIKKTREIEAAAPAFIDFSGGQHEKKVIEGFSLPNSCGDGKFLIEWENLTPESVDIKDGILELQRGKLDKAGVIRATISDDSEEYIRTYNFTVRGTGKVLYENDFSSANSENMDISELDGWSVGGKEMTPQDPSVYNLVIKDPMNTKLSFENARHVLKVERFATASERAVSNDKAMLTFEKPLKYEQTTYDFDFMLLNDCRVLAELFDMQLTFAIDKTGVSVYGREATAFSEPLSTGVWYHASIALDAYAGRYDFYLDYEHIASGSATGVPGMIGMNFYSNAVSTKVKDSFLIADILVRDITPTQDEAVKNGLAAVTLSDIDYGESRIDLQRSSADNTYVIWKSSNPEVISENGVVTRKNQDTEVTLTCEVKKGEAVATRDFTVIVRGLSTPVYPTDEIMRKIADGLTFDMLSDEKPLKLTKNLTMPNSINTGLANDIGGVKISWESSAPGVVSTEGEIRKISHEAGVTLTATITSKMYENISIQKEFVVAVYTDSVIFREYDFEDLDESLAGESMPELKVYDALERRAFTSGTEYGLRQYIDKTPEDRDLPYDKANKVLYLDRVLTSKLASIPGLDYSRHVIDANYASECKEAKNVAMSFRFMFEESCTITLTLYCMLEQQWYLSLNGISRSNPKPDISYLFDEQLEVGKWYEMMVFYDLSAHTMEFRINGKRVGDAINEVPYLHENILSTRIYNDSMCKFYVDDICYRYLKGVDNESIVNVDCELLSLPECDDNGYVLPNIGQNGSRISFKSSNRDVISDSGKFYPSPDEDLFATLTAIVTKGDYSKTKSFDVIVPKKQLPWRIDNINCIDGALKSVNITKLGSENGELLVLIYDRETLVDIKSMNVSQSGSYNIECDLSNYKNCKVTAFIWNRFVGVNHILSNKKSRVLEDK